MNAEYQLGIHLQMTVELLAVTTPLYSFVADPSGRCPPPLLCFMFFSSCFQQRMSVRMDSSSVTTKGVSRPSGGATTMTTAQTTVMKKTVVSVEINVGESTQTRDVNCEKELSWLRYHRDITVKRNNLLESCQNRSNT